MSLYDTYCKKECKYKGEQRVYKKLSLYDQNNKIDTDIQIPINPCESCQVWHYADKTDEIIWRLEDQVKELKDAIEYYREKELDYIRI